MSDLTDKKILITGGIGFVASHILDLLVERNAKKVILVDNLIRGSQKNIKHHQKNEHVQLIKGDIRNYDFINKIMKNIDYCFHMAAIRINQCSIEPFEAFQTLSVGSFNVARACINNNVKKLIAASSASVYGNANNFPTKESHHPYNNRTFYGALKMSNELMFRSFNESDKLNYIALRFFNIYGTRMDTEGEYTEVLIKWYKRIKEGKSPLIFGDGKQTMDFVNIKDVARSCILAMESDIHDEVFNIASGVDTSLEQLCYELIKTMKVDIEPQYVSLPEERKKVEVLERKASTIKAKELLDFKYEIPLNKGIEELVSWLDALDNKGINQL